jgi:hypothetical protein
MARPLRMATVLSLPFVISLCSLAIAAQSQVQLRDTKGVLHRPLDDKGVHAIVLIFIAHDCPISNRYAAEINRIYATYAPRKIAFYTVYTDADLTMSRARQHAKDFGYRCPALLDPKHLLVKKVRATVTPQAIVLAPSGKVLYRGRIDDTYADFGKSRLKPGKWDLRNALEAIVNGKRVPNPTTTAIGCFITADN